jgi:hypothetical protein
MRKPKFGSWLCALLCVAGAVSPVKSEDQPRPLLKNVSLVAYQVFPDRNKALCAIDWDAWNTAIDFVANQSTKLKLIKEVQHRERDRELLDEAIEAHRKYINGVGTFSDPAVGAAKRAWEEASEIHAKYFAAPKLLLVGDILEQNGRCFGTVSATVSLGFAIFTSCSPGQQLAVA